MSEAQAGQAAAEEFRRMAHDRAHGPQSPKPSSITIHGVPAAVSRDQVMEAIRLLGIDPNEVCGLSFAPMAVHVEVYANQRPGATPAWRWTHDGKNTATHRLAIPIVDKESA